VIITLQLVPFNRKLRNAAVKNEQAIACLRSIKMNVQGGDVYLPIAEGLLGPFELNSSDAPK
jgi:hypothetical protein